MALEDRTARLTILIDPRKKALLERLSAEEDSTVSQLVRRMAKAESPCSVSPAWAVRNESYPSLRAIGGCSSGSKSR